MKRFLLLICILTVSVFLLAGCGLSGSSGGENTETVKVGALLPMTGSMASTGKGMEIAVKLGIEDVNRHLEVSGSPVRLSAVYADSATDPSTALEKLKEFHAQGIKFVIGPGSSAEAAAVLDYANANGILLISSSTAPSLAIAGDNLLRLAPSDENQAKGLAMMMNREGHTRLITVNLDNNYGNELSAAVRTEFTTLGGSVEASFTYPAGTQNFSALVAQIKTAVDAAVGTYGASAVAVQLSSLEEAVALFDAARGTTLENVRWYGSDGNADQSIFFANADSAAFAAAVSLMSPEFTIDEEALAMPKKVIPDRALRERIYTLNNGVTNVSSLVGYDAAWLIGLGLMEKGASASADDIIQAVFDVTSNTEPGLAGVSGRLELTAAGDKEDSGYSFHRMISSSVSQVTDAYTFSGVTPQIITVSSTGISLPDVPGGTIKLGVLVPKTGGLAQAGMSALKGIENAADSINSYYAFYGSSNRVALSVEDTATDPDTAVAALKKLHGEGITLVTGVISSSVAEALLPYLSSYGMTLISPAATSDALAVSGDNLYRFILSDAEMANALTMLLKEDGKTDITIIYRNDTWGGELAQSVATDLAAAGLTVKASITYEPDSVSSYRKAVDSAEDAVSSSTEGKSAVLLLSYEEGTQILEYSSGSSVLKGAAWYGGDGFAKNSSLFDSDKAANFAEETGFTCAIYSIIEVGSKTVPEPISRMVVRDKLHEKLGYDPITYAYTAWDSVWIGALAYGGFVNDSATTLGGQINTFAGKYIGLSNYMALNSAGDRRFGEYGFFTVKDGKWALTATYHHTPIDFPTPAITRP